MYSLIFNHVNIHKTYLFIYYLGRPKWDFYLLIFAYEKSQATYFSVINLFCVYVSLFIFSCKSKPRSNTDQYMFFQSFQNVCDICKSNVKVRTEQTNT